MHISQFILDKVNQVKAWCGQKAAHWQGWWVTTVTPSWNALCMRVHGIFISRASNPTKPVEPLPPLIISPPAPKVGKKDILSASGQTGPISAAGKRLPEVGFRNNDQRSCEQISQAVAILSLAPDVVIPENQQDATYQAEINRLSELRENLNQLQTDLQQNKTGIAGTKQKLENARTELWTELGEDGELVENGDLIQRANNKIGEIRKNLTNPDEEYESDDEDDFSEPVPTLNIADQARKNNIKKIESRILTLDKACKELESIEEQTKNLKTQIQIKTEEIRSSQERIQTRLAELQLAREAVDIWQKGNNSPALQNTHALAIRSCHPASKIFTGPRPIFKGKEEATEAEKDEHGHIKVLREILDDPKRSAAIQFGGTGHWQALVRLQDGRFIRFNDDKPVAYWTRQEILDLWSDPDQWPISQPTFIPEWRG